MKYKVGDKVIIKTQEEFKKEFGHASYSFSFNNGGIGSGFGSDNNNIYRFTKHMEDKIEALFPNRVVTIKTVGENSCIMEGFGNDLVWEEWMIKGRQIECYSVEDSVTSRFEMLDL